MSEINGEDNAFIVLYPTGGIALVVGPESEGKAMQRAQLMKGILCRLPVVADYRPVGLKRNTTNEEGTA